MSSPLHLARLRKWLTQSPPAEWLIQYVRDLLLGALRQGPVPQHVAFVMDGNRRFARNHHIEVIEGHNLGFEALARVLEVCYKIGVRTVTIYAFSIENFKRSKYEVNALMEMAKVKLTQLAAHGDLLARYGAKMQFLGQRDLIRPDVLTAIDKAIAMTEGNGRAILNICAPYTSRDEMTTAIRKTVEQWNTPLQPRVKRPFSETRISRTIRAQRLSISEGQGKDVKSPILAPQQRQEQVPREPVDPNYHYTPTTSDTEAAYNAFLEKTCAHVWQQDNSEGDRPDSTDPHIIEVAQKTLAVLIQTSLTDEQAVEEIATSAGLKLSPDDIPVLCDLADGIDDYNNTSSFISSSQNGDESTSTTTLNNLSTTRSSDHLTLSEKLPLPDPENITASSINANTFTGPDCPPLDILVRTSGVERLSDFMLWQCHQQTEVAFLKCMWPEFDLWHFLPVLLEWQAGRMKAAKGESRGEGRRLRRVKSGTS